MVQMAIWVFGTTFALALMVMSVAIDHRWAQFALSIVVAMAMCVSAIRHFSIYRAASTHPGIQSAVVARYMGLLWAWASVALVLLYVCLLDIGILVAGTLVMTFGAALVLLLVAKILDRDAIDGDVDPSTMTLVRLIARLQFVSTCIAVGGLVAFGKLSVGTASTGLDWAAVNILLTTAIALAILSAFYLAFVDADLAAHPATPASTAEPPSLPTVRTGFVAAPPRPLRKVQSGKLRTA